MDIKNIIKKHYDNLNYFDNYTSNLILFIAVTIVFALGVSYCILMINKQKIQDNWVDYRCNPLVMPFAGVINPPDDEESQKTYTSDNFNYCSQELVKSSLSVATLPVTYTTSVLTNMINILSEAINAIREMMNEIRNLLEKVTSEVMGRLGNVMIPAQTIIVKIKNFVSQIAGVLTASLYTVFGLYYTLQSLMGAIAEFITDILIGIAITVAILWAIPFTWGAAAALTVVFLAIAIPMAIILVFMIDVLKVKSNIKIPSVKCFDENTKIELKDSVKIIKNVKVGDKLKNGSKVTSTIKLAKKGSTMYRIGKTIVSDTHQILHNNNWILVSNHPDAEKIEKYNKKYIYCLNTSNKKIEIDNKEYLDWDEIYNMSIFEFFEELKITKEEDINKRFDGGFAEDTIIKTKNEVKYIKDIKVGEVLKDGSKVYGIVKMNGRDLINSGVYKKEDGTNICCGGNLRIKKNNGKKIEYMNLKDEFKVKEKKKIGILYNILTDSGEFEICNILFQDYCNAVDFFYNI